MTRIYLASDNHTGKRVILATLFAISCFTTIAIAADEKQMAITDPSQADDDFRLQGEYCGRICDSRRCWRRVGLQVCALGDGKFSAVEYPGGLPGAGWSRHHKFQLSGQRKGDTIWLASNRCQFIVDGGRAKAFSVGGRRLGDLRRVERTSPTMGAAPPRCAIVLFDESINRFKNGKTSADGWLQMGTETLDAYQDFTMHLEFRLPYMPYARGQGRANSGIYVQSRYEVQVLDSFSLEGEFNECGALYRLRKPDVNMCLPPLRWQTYDIGFRAPRFDAEGNKLCDARITVVHNGVPVHYDKILSSKTGAGKQEGPDAFPTKLQDHGNPVVFRNIWLLDHSRVGHKLATGKNQSDRLFAARKSGSRLLVLDTAQRR